MLPSFLCIGKKPQHVTSRSACLVLYSFCQVVSFQCQNLSTSLLSRGFVFMSWYVTFSLPVLLSVFVCLLASLFCFIVT